MTAKRTNLNEMRPSMFRLKLLPVLSLLIACGCSEDQSPTRMTSAALLDQHSVFNYSSSSQTNIESAVLLETASPGMDESVAVGKFAETIGLLWPSGESERLVDGDGEYTIYRQGVDRFKYYAASGAMTYAKSDQYNKMPASGVTPQALGEEEAKERALAFSRALNNAGLLNIEELDFESVRVYNRMVQGVDGNGAVSEAVAVDTRVEIPREIDGIPVLGNSLRIVFEEDGTISSVKLRWRSLTKSEQRFPIVKSLAEARSEFESNVSIGSNKTFEVSRAMLVYRDASLRDTVDFLEPEQYFEYVVHTPRVSKSGVDVVSKTLEYRAAATVHGRLNSPSARKMLEQQRQDSEPADDHQGTPQENNDD